MPGPMRHVHDLLHPGDVPCRSSSLHSAYAKQQALPCMWPPPTDQRICVPFFPHVPCLLCAHVVYCRLQKCTSM
jgi:hypothetical protein